MHNLKEWQILLFILIATILVSGLVTFNISSCDVIAMDNRLSIMEHEVDIGDIILQDGHVYTIKWYSIFNHTFKTRIIKMEFEFNN